ncbi:hypothetical protein FF2_037837 [Malus domestica]
MAMKLDMSKAFDHVEWLYLNDVMLKLGFYNRWVELLMLCISIVSYFFLINGAPCGYLYLERGLRQGEPLSLYLFLGAPLISHLFFADDNLLFTRANANDSSQIIESL